MRVVIAADSFPPALKAGAMMIEDLAHAMAAQGADVVVLAPGESGRLGVTREGGLTISRARDPGVKSAARLRRLLAEITLPARLWRAFARTPARRGRVDLFVWYSPSIFLGPLAWAMRLRGARTYLILRDIFPDWAADVGLIRRDLAFYALRAADALQRAAADRIGVQSPGDLAAMPAAWRTRAELLWNWRRWAAPAPGGGALLRALGLEGRAVIVFGGTLGVAQDLDGLVRLAERLREEADIALLVVGDGPERGRLAAAAHQRGLANLILHPPLPEPAFRALLGECAAGLALLDRRLTNQNVPGKILSYMQARLPVLAALNPGNDLFALLGRAGAGVCVESGDDAALADAARRLARDPALRRRMGEAGHALGARLFDAAPAARQILSVLPAAAAAQSPTSAGASSA